MIRFCYILCYFSRLECNTWAIRGVLVIIGGFLVNIYFPFRMANYNFVLIF